jgi:menaquinol-cytochrome c reductase iron-sulfur subunit
MAPKIKENQSRRSLIVGTVYAIPVLIGGTLVTSIANYLFGRKTVPEAGWADAGDVKSLASGAPQQLRFERVVVDGWRIRNEESSVWVILDERRNVTAFSPLCTHLGCAYRWQADKGIFSCPCHGSAFNVRGEVITGPATRPLDQYPTKLEGNRLWLGPLPGNS